jgi:putative ABC transport system permease protein
VFDLDKWTEILESVNRHKLRTTLTAFGVFWGIFMLVLLMGAGNGLFNSIKYEFSDVATNSIWLSPGRTSKPYKGLNKGRRIKFDNTDYEFLRDNFDGVDEITGRFYITGNRQVVYKDKNLSYSINSIHPSFKTMENMTVTAGRFLTDEDLKHHRKVCIIGNIVRDNLFEDEDPIGKEINVGGIVYTVIGTFYDIDDWVMKNIYIPITTAQKVYSGNRQLNRIMFTTTGLTVEEVSKIEKEVAVAFAGRKNFDVTDRRAIWSENNAEDFEEFASLMLAIKGIIWLVGIFSMIAGVIGVSNIMLIIVKDRTKEIGIRKSLGATPVSIITMILQESILITSVAGFIGVGLGVLVIGSMSGIKSDFFRTPHVDISVVLIATLILILSGALAGLIPAMKAARINPVIAMKAD